LACSLCSATKTATDRWRWDAEPKQHAAPRDADVPTKLRQDAGHVFLADYQSSHRENPKFELWTDVNASSGKRLK
jgi:hypothetical protein